MLGLLVGILVGNPITGAIAGIVLGALIGAVISVSTKNTASKRPALQPIVRPAGEGQDGVPYPTFANGKPAIDEMGDPVSAKSRLAATLLALFVGVLGIHRFYVGKIGTGVLMIVTLGGLGIWVLVDLIMILVGSFADADGRRLYNW